MMKRLASVLACSLVCLLLSAAPIDKVGALKVAKSFVQSAGLEMNVAPEPFAFEHHAASAAEPARLYIFTDTDGTGFVVVAGEDQAEDILGYSETQAFDSQNIPANMQGWLEGISLELASVREGGIPAKSEALSYAPIEPLLTSTWGQDAPYNANSPTVGNNHCPTGCLATAVAQIMYHNRWPEAEVSGIDAYTTQSYKVHLDALPPTSFDWEHIYDSYDRNSSDTEEVAKLMQYVGHAMKMDYTPNASGATDEGLPELLVSQFGYYESVRRLRRESFLVSQWYDVIYNELAENRPVLYCGYTPNMEGHAFVCDGYDGQGFFHINWGWDGLCDGYFRLSVLNPENTTSSGSASTNDGFTEKQTIVVGIQANGPDTSLNPWGVKSIEHLVRDGNYLKITLNAADTGTYEIALATLDDAGYHPVVEPTVAKCSKDRPTRTGFYIDALGEGHHVLYIVLRRQGDDDWQRVGSSSQYAEVIIGEEGLETVIVHPVIDLEVVDADFPEGVETSSSPARYDISLRNHSDEFNGAIYVFSGTNGEPSRNHSALQVAMMPEEECQLSANIRLPSVTDITLYVCTDSEGSNIVYEHPYHGYNLSIDDVKISCETPSVVVTLRNNSLVAYTEPITANIYENGEKYAIKTITLDADLKPGETLDIGCPFDYDTEKTYFITFQHRKSELCSKTVSIDGRVEVDFNATAISHLHSDDHHAPLYTLDARRATRSKGLVIKKNRKYLQK